MVAIHCPNEHPIAMAEADGSGVITLALLPDGSMHRGKITHKHTITCGVCGGQRTWHPRTRSADSRRSLTQQVRQLLPAPAPALT